MVRKRREFEYVRERELHSPVLSVFVEKGTEDGPSFGPKFAERGARPKAVGAFTPGANRRVEGQMAEQIQRVGFGLTALKGEMVDVDAAFAKFRDDRMWLVLPFASQQLRDDILPACIRF